MKIAVLGTGMVGNAIASKLVVLGHDVTMGSRTADNVKAAAWTQAVGPRGRAGTFADAAVFGELVFNCTHGANSLAALSAAGAANLEGKIVVDVANVLPPLGQGSDSLGEQIQKAFPRVRLVKTLNTVTANLMVNPGAVNEGDHTLFLCGNDADAKATVKRWLGEWFGWRDILDLGDVTASRGMEMYLPIWLRMWGAVGSPMFNVKLVR